MVQLSVEGRSKGIEIIGWVNISEDGHRVDISHFKLITALLLPQGLGPVEQQSVYLLFEGI